MKESSIQRSVIDYAKKKYGALCKKLSVQGPMGNAGWPDYMILGKPVYRHKVIFFIEFKAPGGRLTALQAHMRDEIGSRGFNYYYVDSVALGKTAVDSELDVDV